ncbi:hypothetical protein Ait01nite_100990 [Actinoplanes italicus]|uniref:Sporulation protein YtfJ n=2 Tax=Actinoplanes italicus TaxID=113567 RepID=A0A2T0K5F2_9ACTN|nr:sporulation protein YtfJ [Actinoplanes italicus]GIE37054.1 hypothetical protein Ait01nite_100990 [Actinoplanes italicus]
MSASEILERIRTGTEAATVSRVFGEPIERDGVTVVPVATIKAGGGAGGGSGAPVNSDNPQGEGVGGGFGFEARPAGVFLIRDGDVCWRPAVDVNKIVVGGQLALVAGFLVIRSIVRRRRRR